MRKVLIGVGLTVILLAMSAAAVMAKPPPARTVNGGGTIDDPGGPGRPSQSLSVSMHANERTQSGNLTLRAVVDETRFQYGFRAEITCVVFVTDDVVLVAGTVTTGTDPNGEDATGKIIRRFVRDDSPDRAAGGFPDVADIPPDCFASVFAAINPAGLPLKTGNYRFNEVPR